MRSSDAKFSRRHKAYGQEIINGALKIVSAIYPVMSDLLPLVAAALNDKVAGEAHEEIIGLRRDLEVSRSLEIVRANGNDEDEATVVYASAQFLSGRYSRNPDLWQVDFVRGSSTCRLSDLSDCVLCVGGGFPLASLGDGLGNHASFRGYAPSADKDGDNAKAVSFVCPNSICVKVLVHGWPRHDWEFMIEVFGVAPEDMVSLLVESIASDYPEATVEFVSTSFLAKTIHGALKRLLPPRRRLELQAERDDERDTDCE
jgi:hypothetical protein